MFNKRGELHLSCCQAAFCLILQMDLGWILASELPLSWLKLVMDFIYFYSWIPPLYFKIKYDHMDIMLPSLPLEYVSDPYYEWRPFHMFHITLWVLVICLVSPELKITSVDKYLSYKLNTCISWNSISISLLCTVLDNIVASCCTSLSMKWFHSLTCSTSFYKTY
jgi:hypothetical protein